MFELVTEHRGLVSNWFLLRKELYTIVKMANFQRCQDIAAACSSLDSFHQNNTTETNSIPSFSQQQQSTHVAFLHANKAATCE